MSRVREFANRMGQAGRLWVTWQVTRHFGLPWVAARASFLARKRSGWFERRTPAGEWSTIRLEDYLADTSQSAADWLTAHRGNAPPFFFGAGDRTAYAPILRAFDKAPTAPADRLRAGEFRYFAHQTASLSFPPDWHKNPWTGQRAPAETHWSRLGDFDYGDVKILWEPSRFAFVYDLARAYWRSGDEACPETFWTLLESWRDANQPNRGVNWKEEQEIAVRVVAWFFALYAFADSPSTTDARLAELVKMIAFSGERIVANLGYPLSQRNNHGMTVGMALWTIGLLLPELRHAAPYKTVGREILTSHARELIYDDGSFAQHSFQYQRVMLHAYLWSLRLGEMHGDPLPEDIKTRIARSAVFLYQLQDQATGKVPSYGHVDGALILPLDGCDYLDFRPVLGAVHYLASGTRLYDPGPWDEDLVWLFGPPALESRVEPTKRTDLAATSGGYYTLRSPEGFLLARAGSFRHRPSQADLLHVDVWWRGQNIAIDAGTYSYNAPSPWNNALGATAVHNTITVDGASQMRHAGRFLWLPWAAGRASAIRSATEGPLAYWEGSHDGFARLGIHVTHRRAVVRLPEDHFLVMDFVAGAHPHHYHLHWLLADAPHRWKRAEQTLALDTPAGEYWVRIGVDTAASGSKSESTLVCADPHSVRGWCAPYYNDRQPALSWDLAVTARRAMFWSILGPTQCRVSRVPAGSVGAGLEVASADWHATIEFAEGESEGLPVRCQLAGPGAARQSLDIDR